MAALDGDGRSVDVEAEITPQRGVEVLEDGELALPVGWIRDVVHEMGDGCLHRHGGSDVAICADEVGGSLSAAAAVRFRRMLTQARLAWIESRCVGDAEMRSRFIAAWRCSSRAWTEDRDDNDDNKSSGVRV